MAREIARIVGATKREEGYFEGGGYAVTWAFGHLVQLAMPDGYGIRGFVRDNLPVIPETFTLIPRQEKTEKGYKPDSGVVSQIKIISRLFNESEQIIVATDAGREGELIFRYLYHYIGCTTPFVRLWISSLTDKAIREGLRNLEAGSKYDNLYLAAKARSESDWLVGINGTQALSIAAGHGTYSIGRVQTPTLAMVCARYWENRRFTVEPFWQLHIAADDGNGEVVKFSSSEKWKAKEPATELYNKVKEAGFATVTKAERKEKTEDTPLLYDLTTLQKEANAKHGFTAEQTLEIAQKLYERKLITYPRTGSRYIPEDVFVEIPKLLAFIGNLPEWKEKINPKAVATRRSVDGGKVTDHHALLVTGEKPLFLSKEDNTVYQMIAGRMIEAFSEKCVKDTATVTAECAGAEFVAKGSIIKQAGWRAVYGEEEKEESILPSWQEGDTLTLKAASITEGKTKPKPLHTEATLLSAMETAGKEIEDDALRQALKDCGIGTPATRAAIIETLFKRGYMERCKKSLVPTEKGLALYSVVKTMRIADVAMTGGWELALSKIATGEMDAPTFHRGIEVFTSQIAKELLEARIDGAESDTACPRCGRPVVFYPKLAKCQNPDCGLTVWRTVARKELTDKQLAELLTKGKTGTIRGFVKNGGGTFNAALTLDDQFKTSFVFEPRDTPRQGKRNKRK